MNSARATRGADIEETAFKTNCEAADEVARQMRLRDLGGLIVIDFIDMAEAKNQRAVEQRLKDAIRYDRARVQTAKISRFGLMELSRQRLRPSLSEGSHITCPRCNGVGVIRDTESCAIQVLRILQEEAMKEGTGSVRAQVPVDVATFLLNEKRNDITKLEARHRVPIVLVPNTSLETPHYHIERIRQDDERLEVQEPSFKLAETIETVADDPYAQKSQEEKPLRPKQVPVIKNLIERDPAPVQTAESKKAEQKANAGRVKQLQPVEPKKSLFKRIIGFFLGTSDNKAEQSEKSAKTNRRKRIVTAEPTNGAVHAALAVTVRNAATAAVLLAENDSNARIVWNDRKLQRRLRRRNVRNVRAASARSVQNGLNVPNASNVPIGRSAKTAAAAASRLSSSRRMSRRKNSP